MIKAKRRALALFTFATVTLTQAACDSTGGLSVSDDQVLAPGVDLRAEARDDGTNDVEVGHRLIAAGEYELAIDAFNRAALDRGKLDAELLSGFGTAYMGLGRFNQAEKLLRRAVAEEDAQPVDYNNLGVLLMEQDKTAEAVQYFQRAFALSNGENIAIRDNLRLALEKTENSATTDVQKTSEYKLVQRGNADFVIRPTPN